MLFFSKYDREVVRVFQIREHQAKIVKLGRYVIQAAKIRTILTGDYVSLRIAKS